MDALCNAQSTYQRIHDLVLKDLPDVAAYVDDACVFTSTFTQHISGLERTLNAYRDANMQLKRSKCKFGYDKLDFLGHSINADGRTPMLANVETILTFPAPTNKKELQRFLGMANFYRCYIPNMAESAAPLYTLTGSSTPFAWNEEAQKSFEDVKMKLADPQLLAYVQWDNIFFLETDASSTAVGGVLSQTDKYGRRRPIAFFSSGLTDTQKNYHAGELECWAILAATRKWKEYIQAATKVIVLSDHNPLTWLRKQKDPRGKFARWLMELEAINYEIQYRKLSCGLSKQSGHTR